MQLGRRANRPILIGEFGIHRRCPSCHAETRWVRDAVGLFDRFGFHWAYWAYKTLSGPYFPNGLLRLAGNPGWLRREGVQCGWENFGAALSHGERGILLDLDSRRFLADDQLIATLKLSWRH